MDTSRRGNTPPSRSLPNLSQPISSQYGQSQDAIETQSDDTESHSAVSIDKVSACGVCGDKVYKPHWGIDVCDSCRGFFKRAIKNAKEYECKFQCAREACVLNK